MRQNKGEKMELIFRIFEALLYSFVMTLLAWFLIYPICYIQLQSSSKKNKVMLFPASIAGVILFLSVAPKRVTILSAEERKQLKKNIKK